MTNDEKLSFFMELINCNYQLYHWEYNQEFHLMHTDYTKALFAPVFFLYSSLEQTVRKRLDSHDLSVKTRAAIFKCFENIPTIPTNTLNQYAVMLHYCLNAENIPAGAVSYLSNSASFCQKEAPHTKKPWKHPIP